MEKNLDPFQLPDEALLHIFSFFNKEDQGKISLVSKHFNIISKDSTLESLPYSILDYSQLFQAKCKLLNTELTASAINIGIRAIGILSNQHFVTATTNGLLEVWDIKQTASIKTFDKHRQGLFPSVYKIIPISSTQFISCGSNGQVYLWDINQDIDKSSNHYEPLIKFEGHSGVIHEALLIKKDILIS